MRIFGYTLFAVLFPKLHRTILSNTRLLSLLHPLHPENNDMNSLTAEESLAAVQALGDTIVATRNALADVQAANAETQRILAPLAEKNAALKAQVDQLAAANDKLVAADAQLDAALTAQLERLNPPAVVVETPVAETPVIETPVTDEAGAEVPVTPDADPVQETVPEPTEPAIEVDPATAEVQ